MLHSLFSTASRADETLTGLRADVRTPPEEDDDSSPKDDRSDSGSSWDDDAYEDDAYDEGDSDGSFLGLCALAVASPFWGPHMLMMDSFSRPGYFAHYPYQYDVGYMLIDPAEAFGLDGPCQPRPCALRVRGEVGTGFDDLDWIGGKLLIDTSSRWGIDSDVRYVREDLDASRDSLWLGDANVLFRFAQSEFLQFHTGLGMNYLSDTVGSEFGFNFTYGFDFQPVRPLVFSAELDLGTLGHASVVHVRTTAGVVYGPGEAFVGYDLYDIGSTQIQGLAAGVQIWY
ncbi:MAG: hypothetical protein L0211_19610 [Planctomycetaceae bacterium]|nr:hypothetical protein [Planctomycetaceae bacterium]